MQLDQQQKSARRLEQVLLAFFGLVTCSLMIIYATDPSIYTQTLLLASTARDRYPWPATLFLVGIAIFLAILVWGILRRWRWLFWLLLLAFGFSILEIPATLLQLAGFLPAFPGPFPLWYSVYRMSIAAIEGGIAVWMSQVYRQHGVWALGKREGSQRDVT